MKPNPQPWIFSARFDTWFILAPALLISLTALIFSDPASQLNLLPDGLWLVLIVGIDAGHVYSTLFRTYLVRDELRHRQTLLTLTPILAWLAGCLLYSIDSMVFWRALAYLALFHFIRQQYGFMMIYGRNERDLPRYYKLLDKAAIYLATLYPVIYWHCHQRTFDWFIEDDFLKLNAPWLSFVTGGFYLTVLLAYLVKEIALSCKTRKINRPRNLMLLGTALSWYVGIVAFNNDLIFTACNVIAHGVPYYALVWAYGYKQTRISNSSYVFAWLDKLFNWKTVPLYLFFLFGLAFLEEGIWDGLIWREHWQVFRLFNLLPAVGSSQALAWLVPLLALPQATHYLLDAFIWRLHRKDTEWKKILFYQLPEGH